MRMFVLVVSFFVFWPLWLVLWLYWKPGAEAQPEQPAQTDNDLLLWFVGHAAIAAFIILVATR
jgi:hypothetical protein